jgi:hypothetical protein
VKPPNAISESRRCEPQNAKQRNGKTVHAALQHITQEKQTQINDKSEVKHERMHSQKQKNDRAKKTVIQTPQSNGRERESAGSSKQSYDCCEHAAAAKERCVSAAVGTGARTCAAAATAAGAGAATNAGVGTGSGGGGRTGLSEALTESD